MNRDREALDDFVSRVVNHYDNNSGTASQLINYDLIHEAISLALPPAGGVEVDLMMAERALDRWYKTQPRTGPNVSRDRHDMMEALKAALSPTTLGEES